MYPQSGPSGHTPISAPTTEADRIAAFKQNTNFRSVTRNDPSVKEILETSVYSVIYLYDEAAGAWEKQKQEGPLFIVRRDKAPEYALYMLNRQAVKNVTMPLIPGEMKATIVDPTTLQVARRGEKVKRGIWFSDGAEDVERFRQTILRICGEPVKKPVGTGSPALLPPSAPAISSAAAQATPPSDGLSRLFAGLTTTSGVSSPAKSTPRPEPSHSPSPLPKAVSQPVQPAQISSLPPQPSQQPIQPRYDEAQNAYIQHQSQQPVQSPFVPVSQPNSQPNTAASPAPPIPEPSPFSPGQTVDDLLNSILGVASPPPPPASTQTTSAVPTPQPQAPPHQAQSPLLPPPHPMTTTRVGSNSFAQAAGATSPIPPTTRPNLMTNLEAEIFRNERSGAPSPAASAPPLQSVQLIPHQQPSHPMAIHPAQTQAPIPMPKGRPQEHNVHPMVDAVVRPLQNRPDGGGMRAASQVDEAGKRAFVQDLLHLIHTDQSFVDEVWKVFVSRTQGGPAR